MPTINSKACVVDGKPVDKVYSNGRKIYGRNLLTGTSGEWHTWTGTLGGGLSHPTAKNAEAGIRLTVGKKYTYSVNLVSPIDSHVIVRLISDDNNSAKEYFGNIVTVGDTGISTVTFDVASGYTKAIFYSLRAVNSNTETHTWQFKDEKLEQGTIHTAWSPAPEDVM